MTATAPPHARSAGGGPYRTPESPEPGKPAKMPRKNLILHPKDLQMGETLILRQNNAFHIQKNGDIYIRADVDGYLVQRGRTIVEDGEITLTLSGLAARVRDLHWRRHDYADKWLEENYLPITQIEVIEDETTPAREDEDLSDV